MSEQTNPAPSSSRTYAPLPFTLVMAGGVPRRGSAVKDDYFYILGKRVGDGS